MSACEHYQELISRMLDEDLDAGERALLADHLETCPDCAALVAAFSALSSTLSEDLEEAPASLRENVMAQLRREDIKKKNRLSRPMRNLLGAAACLVLIAGISFTLRHLPFAAGGSNSSGAAVSADTAAQEAAISRMAENNTAAPPIAGGTALDDGAEAYSIAPANLDPIPMPEEILEAPEFEPEERDPGMAEDLSPAEDAPLFLQPDQAEALLTLLSGEPAELGAETWLHIPHYEVHWDTADGSVYINIFFDGDMVYYSGTEIPGICLACCPREELEDFLLALQDS